jgi:hypothetical protein
LQNQVHARRSVDLRLDARSRRFLKSGHFTETAQGPGGTSGNTESPLSLVCVDHEMPLLVSSMVTFAFGTAAPLAPVIVPSKVPLIALERQCPQEE